MDVSAMTSKRQSDFEDRFYDFIQSALNRLENKIDGNTKLTEQVKVQAEKTNGRVGALEKEVFGRIKPSDLPPWWRDPKLMGFLFNISLALVLLLAFLTRVNIAELLP